MAAPREARPLERLRWRNMRPMLMPCFIRGEYSGFIARVEPTARRARHTFLKRAAAAQRSVCHAYCARISTATCSGPPTFDVKICRHLVHAAPKGMK